MRAGPQRVAIAVAIAIALASVAGSAASDPLVQETKGVVVDWRRGVLIAHGGAAGDLRMPSAEMARAGAQRRATDAGRARLGEALRALPLGGGRKLDASSIERALQRAQPKRVEYQTNGGVLLDLELPFGAWNEASPAGEAAAAVTLRLGEGALAAAPTLLVGDSEVTFSAVRYALASELPADSHPVVVHADKKGRLIPKEAGAAKDLASKSAVIYVQKILR
ncbi:MAG TPA: hypothetical protein VHU40_21105 [Polyangia bacterium]|nr:hypothetical protein [Polyangia bacterium]